MRFVFLAIAILATSVAHADSRDPIRLRVGTLAITGSRYMKDMSALAAEIDKRTHGSVQLDWVADGQLGEERDMAKLVRANKLDGGGFSETGLVALVPEMSTWGAPGRFHSYEEADKAIAAADAKLRETFARSDLQLVLWADLGFARIFARARIRELANVLGDPALAMPIDGTLTSAIAKGNVDRWVLPPLYMLAVGNQARFMSNIRYRYVVGALVFSRSAWSRISPADQAIVLDVCREWEPKIRASWRKETERGIAALDRAGVQTVAATDADIAAFLDATAAQR
jgi:TRAP-type C4-dicarboxylate transport system substrate-binding protein